MKHRQPLTRWLAVLRVVVLLALPMAATAPARADACGAAGARACNVDERIPSCDVNLVEGGGMCVRPNCGAEGQRLCTVIQRTTFNWVLMSPIVLPQPCDIDLKDIGGACHHPASCGRDGQTPCDIFTRIPSCDINLVESGGRCKRPDLCGQLGQVPCGAGVRGLARVCDANLVARLGQCMGAGTADAATGTTAAVQPPARKLAATTQPTTATPTGAMQQDTDRAGNDLYGFNVAQADPAMCQTACSVNAQCLAWTYVKPGVQGPAPRCYVKSAAAPATANNCCVSGAKSSASPLLLRR